MKRWPSQAWWPSSEPAFWLGQPRTNVGSFTDYFSLISGFERFRAGQFGIRHYCTIGLNPKEANNEALAEAVIDALPRFLVKEGVVAMGELGYDEQTPLEDKALRAQIELAKEFELPIMIHTPHRDKRPGTLRTMDVLKEHGFGPGALRHRPQQRRDRSRGSRSRVSGAHFRFIPTPRWAANEWLPSSRAMARSA